MFSNMLKNFFILSVKLLEVYTYYISKLSSFRRKSKRPIVSMPSSLRRGMIWSFTMIIFLKESLIYYKMHKLLIKKLPILAFFNEIVRENLRLQTGAFPHLFCRVFLLLIPVICKSDLTEYHFIILFALLMSEGLTVITRFLWPPSS